MGFRGKPQSQEVVGTCWCGRATIRTVWADDDIVDSCEADIFHNPNGSPPVYVRVEVVEGRAYTYQSFQDPPLTPGEWVVLPGNEVHHETFAGKVLRVLDGPDKNYDGPYKQVLGRVL